MRVTFYMLEDCGVSISRFDHYPGADEPSIVGEAIPDRAWNDDRDPTDREEERAGS